MARSGAPRTSRPSAAPSARTPSLLSAACAAFFLAAAILLPGSAQAATPATALGKCATGQLCLWAKSEFRGKRQVHELSGVDVESCTPLAPGTSAQALANRTGRSVTTYQSAECAETGEFQTYPGDGVWLPQSPYQVRAFKVWED
ncbi:peptidase inhibitor family I36 protein [Streptomyces sp. NPDC006879]|uniref:peptidase inhibitor family I36 protein n=1 Tax=Streptomyces sp. NPDC006879 TaxID=3364767 RepID=UPI0036CD39B1